MPVSPRRLAVLCVFWLLPACAFAAENPAPTTQPDLPPRWSLGKGMSTAWNVAADEHLPHEDFIEQGGLRVGQVVTYAVNKDRALSLKHTVVWPSLRTSRTSYAGHLAHAFKDEAEPAITVDGAPMGDIKVDQVVLDGTVTITGTAATDMSITRREFVSPTVRTTVDLWTVRNTGKKVHTLAVAPMTVSATKAGPFGTNLMEAACTAPPSTELAPGEEMRFAVLFSGRLDTELVEKIDPLAEEAARMAYVDRLEKGLKLETPLPEFDRAFDFCKLRVAEAINATKGAWMLAPGGLAYYAACWCNDNVEYAGPFFPFLGEPNANWASLETYRLYRPYMKPDYKRIPYSIVAEGLVPDGPLERGDAAMYAYGCSRFCLARGDRAIAEELWPGIEWCLEYCKRKMTPDGVIASGTDELEGRFPTGKANLSTSSLCYGGLRSAADLGRALGKDDEAKEFDQRADALAASIDKYFGANVEGFATYRYYDGNDVLRSWICLPLCMNLTDRREATIAALFSPRLWTVDGLATQAGDKTFWDRSTLYGFRGAFQAGATAEALPFLTAYTHRRLLGEHVPYPVEAWPEGNQRHLSSESALYCRIFTEGLFGILPTGLDRFRITPHLPEGWPRMALRSIRAFNRDFDIVVERREGKQHLTVVDKGKVIAERDLADGESADVEFP